MAARRRVTPWPAAPLAMVAIGIAILALPARIEGPILLPISPGHGLSLADAVGVLPLVVGALWLHVGLWTRRASLVEWTRARPGASVGLTFAAGLGLGFLLASAFSTFQSWWAVGAALFAAANAVAIAIATRAMPR